MGRHQLRQLILGIITLVVVGLLATSLAGSLSEPQITDRLELYQTDLVLRATELEGQDANGIDWTAARSNLLGDKPLASALEEYQSVRQSAANNLKKFDDRLQKLQASQDGPAAIPSTVAIDLQNAIQKQQDLINQLDLRIGLLQAEQNQTAEALQTWTQMVNRAENRIEARSLVSTANVLIGLWSTPPRLLPDAEQSLQQNLEGWFRYRALARVYELQQRPDQLATLQAEEQTIAQQTLVKLALVGILPTLGSVIGVLLLIVLVGQWWWRNKQVEPRDLEVTTWTVPWDWTTILQVLMVGFFLVGQIAVPLLLQSLGLSFDLLGNRARAAYTLVYYLVMAGSALTVLWLSIKPFQPLPDGWFRLTGKRNGFVWGLGGYFVALPLMLLVSVINQQIWQGQGGSNPLLQIVLEEGDGVALAMFFFTAAVAAPVFEELMFRGFLLPSLTRYFPLWGAIALSSFIFAFAHLSLSEVLPLAVLGSILGFVYTRSGGLLSCMLLHSLWNSVTMIGLFILGSGMD